MQESVAELISERLGAMPAGERRAAQALVANYPVLGLRTVAEFAQQAGVSSPTILRFVARLGFGNYPEFQTALQAEVAARLQSPATRAGERRPAVPSTPGSSPIVDAMIENIRLTHRHLSSGELGDIATLLSRARTVHLVGGRFTDPIARYMAAHLAILRPGIMHLSGQESIWRDRLLDMRKGDVLLVLDIRRYQESLIRFSEAAHGRGADIVLLTDQWLSPIARFARHVVAARTSVPSPWDSSVALMSACELLVAEATRRLDGKGEQRMSALEALRDTQPPTKM
jgi:DNA-binding MurR/RpiR family transcriptional regulator